MQGGGESKKVSRPCFQFAETGSCRFGKECRFVHAPKDKDGGAGIRGPAARSPVGPSGGPAGGGHPRSNFSSPGAGAPRQAASKPVTMSASGVIDTTLLVGDQNQSSQPPPQCLYCEGRHDMMNCPVVREFNPNFVFRGHVQEDDHSAGQEQPDDALSGSVRATSRAMACHGGPSQWLSLAFFFISLLCRSSFPFPSQASCYKGWRG